jgi:hypothetical protein
LIINLGYNSAKDIFANPTGREHEIIRICCAVKGLTSWNNENVSIYAVRDVVVVDTQRMPE